MILSILTASFLISDPSSNCANQAKALATLAGTHQSLGIPSTELSRVFKIPQSYDGDVAVVYSNRDTRAFGISRFERNGFSFIQVWGFERRPLPLMNIYVDLKPFNPPAIEFLITQEIAYLALQKAPDILSFIQSKGFLNYTRDEGGRALAEGEKELERIIAESDDSGNRPFTWTQIRLQLIRQEFERNKKHRATENAFAHLDGASRLPANLSKKALDGAVPNPPNREASKVQFGGWMAGDGDILVLITDIFQGKDQGRSISLHPRFRTLWEPFANPAERIQIEKDFKLEWLGLKDPVIVELTSSSDYRRTYAVVERMDKIPANLGAVRVSPTDY